VTTNGTSTKKVLVFARFMGGSPSSSTNGYFQDIGPVFYFLE
jgi:hypothetical protein